MIEVEHLSKTYGSTAAIADVSFSVETGEILGFLGPNGAGKTTTMRILSGYLPASSGTARIAGLDVHEKSMAVRQRIGYLPENPPLYPEMTVEGFLFFVARIKQVPAGDRARRVTSAIERCGLIEKRKVLIRKLSKGFKQRVGIAQAIVHDPPVIILDEPTVGLDPRQIIEVRNLIKSLAGQHTIILSTHILPEVSMTCSRVTIINRGQIVASGTPEHLMGEFAAGSGYEIEVEGEVELVNNLLFPSLENLPGVRSLELIPHQQSLANRYRLRALCEPDMEPGREMAAVIVASGLGLCEMRRTRTSLEDVFLRMTTADKKPGDVLIHSEPEVAENLEATEIQDSIEPSQTESAEPILENLPVAQRQESPYDSQPEPMVETVESIEHSPLESPAIVETRESIEHSPLESAPIVERPELIEYSEPESQPILETVESIEYSEPESQPILERAESIESLEPASQPILETVESIEYSEPASQPILERAESIEFLEPESQPILETVESIEHPEPEPILETVESIESLEPERETIVENLQFPETPEFSGEVQPEMQPVADFLQVVAISESIEPSGPAVEMIVEHLPVAETKESIEHPEPEPVLEMAELIELSQSEPIVEISDALGHSQPEAIAEASESIELPEAEPIIETVESIEYPQAESMVVETSESIELPQAEPIVEVSDALGHSQLEPQPVPDFLRIAKISESIEHPEPTPEPIMKKQESIEPSGSEPQPVAKNRQIEKKQPPTSDSQPEEPQPVVKNRQMKKKQPLTSDTQSVAKNRQTEKKPQPSSDSETTPIPNNPE